MRWNELMSNDFVAPECFLSVRMLVTRRWCDGDIL